MPSCDQTIIAVTIRSAPTAAKEQPDRAGVPDADADSE